MVVTALPSELPVVLAPMAGGPSTPELTAAVTQAGGFAFLAAGYLTPQRLAAAIASTKELTPAPFGVNIFCPTGRSDPVPIRAYAELLRPEADRQGVVLGEPRWDDDSFGEKLEVVSGQRIPLVSFTFGCPDPGIVDDLHAAGCSVGVTVTSSAEAGYAERAGADLLVVQGTEAGGHQATFLDDAPNLRPLRTLMEDVRSSTSLPMVGSGGITSGEQAAELIRAGAIGVQSGTVFLCCHEAGTSSVHRRALLERAYPDTMLTRAFSGRYARGLVNEFARRYSDGAPPGYPEIHHLTRPLRTAATERDDPRTPNLWAGTGWRAVGTEPAASVIRRIGSELHTAGTGRP